MEEARVDIKSKILKAGWIIYIYKSFSGESNMGLPPIDCFLCRNFLLKNYHASFL